MNSLKLLNAGLCMAALITVIVGAKEAKAFDAAQTLKIEADKGQVQIELTETKLPYEYAIKHTDGCGASVGVTESGNTIKFKHSGEPCLSGNTIVLKINQNLNYVVVLNSGNLTLVNAKNTLKNYAQVKALVDAGMIHSTVAGLVPTRTDGYAGQEVIYRLRQKTSLPVLNVRVNSGMINI